MKTPDDFRPPAHVDDTAAVQAWANAGGGEWARDYTITRPLSFPPGMKLRGSGTLKISPAAPPDIMLWINGPCDIQGLRLDASGCGPAPVALVFVQGDAAAVDLAFANVRHTFALGIIGAGHTITASFDTIAQGVWDGSIGSTFPRLSFRNTSACCFDAGGTKTKIGVLEASDIGECVLMCSDHNRDCEIEDASWSNVRRKPGGDQGCGAEIWGGWTIRRLRGRDVDWSHVVIFDPENVFIYGAELRNPGQGSVPEPGPDSSACIKIYMLEPTAKPRNVVIDYRLLTDQSGDCNAITILGATGSPQIEDLYIVGGAMPGRWRNGQAVDVRQATTDGVARSVCGTRCYLGNTPLPSKPPTKELEPA